MERILIEVRILIKYILINILYAQNNASYRKISPSSIKKNFC